MSIDGKWHLTLVTGGGEETVELFLQSAGEALNGTFDGRPLSEGRLQGARVTFTASITSPIRTRIKCAAQVDGEAMTGEARALFMTVPFTATRSSSPVESS
ncbi:hypothetical protein Asp14428_64930 [Actinoplanes sp. NBRC 14428]|uniref:Uncharacterized protein n=1 Tax=Pseudosporangium ferrugineum TaxID=439699 RepID=A0A2T0RU92_9ACTN|nr:hypothetical protein [Pseudosporangium ferrugineum]PRY24765.1 hypothetical protein CLV70_113203 [Pseudosporangium ferrugineum]BCJ55018.1 hypothetical protein Asp14428_64930 [Actinoplanes sp. NBRC 14428]